MRFALNWLAKPHEVAYKSRMATYTMKDITSKLGIKRTALQQWMERGFISPSIQVAEGHGTKNLWNWEDLLKLAIFQEMIKHHFQREDAAEFLREQQGMVMQLAQGDLESETFAVQVTVTDTAHSFLMQIRGGETFFTRMTQLPRVQKGIVDVRIVNVTEAVKRVAGL